MVLTSQRTIYGVKLQTAMVTGKPYTIKPNTTLNEKFEILKDTAAITLEKGFYPEINYFCIGNGGSTLASGVKGYTYSRHSALDAALFNHIPFVLRDANNDLTGTDKDRYRFKKLINIEGKDYYAYFLKKITTIDVPSELYIVNKLGTDHKLSLFSTNVEELLNPVPIDKSELIDRTDESAFIVSLAKIHFALEAEDLKELENVYKILKIENTPITEVGICSGTDTTYRPIGNTASYTEAMNVQIVFHVGTNLDVATKFGTGGHIRRNIEVGGSEPYYIGMK